MKSSRKSLGTFFRRAAYALLAVTTVGIASATLSPAYARGGNGSHGGGHDHDRGGPNTHDRSNNGSQHNVGNSGSQKHETNRDDHKDGHKKDGKKHASQQAQQDPCAPPPPCPPPPPCVEPPPPPPPPKPPCVNPPPPPPPPPPPKPPEKPPEVKKPPSVPPGDNCGSDQWSPNGYHPKACEKPPENPPGKPPVVTPPPSQPPAVTLAAPKQEITCSGGYLFVSRGHQLLDANGQPTPCAPTHVVKVQVNCPPAEAHKYTAAELKAFADWNAKHPNSKYAKPGYKPGC